LNQILLQIEQYFDFYGFMPIFFSCFFSFSLSPPFYSLYLLPFIPFLSTGKILAPALQITWNGTLINCTQDWTRFSGTALPEFG